MGEHTVEASFGQGCLPLPHDGKWLGLGVAPKWVLGSGAGL